MPVSDICPRSDKHRIKVPLSRQDMFDMICPETIWGSFSRCKARAASGPFQKSLAAPVVAPESKTL